MTCDARPLAHRAEAALATYGRILPASVRDLLQDLAAATDALGLEVAALRREVSSLTRERG
ncbi:MAG TPA: hypothetical protein P5024_12220 [Burkholderiaceae bacterium]|nr:hypothetical protein [Burkholderiaceae bacterium]